MQRAIIVHGCADEKDVAPELRTYDKHWMPWLKNALLNHGWQVDMPQMPNPWEPIYEAYKTEFEKHSVSEDVVLIGHSCGSAFLVRWLGDSKQKIDTLVMVAPWKIPDGNDAFRKAFYEYPIDLTIKDRVRKIVIFTANDEESEGKESAMIFHNALMLWEAR